MKDIIKYDTPKNDADFKEYYQVAISMNKYIERLLEKIMRNKGIKRFLESKVGFLYL